MIADVFNDSPCSESGAARSFLGRRSPTIDSSFMTRKGPRFPRKKPLTRRKQPTT